jgi:hypothetical protein
MTQKLLVSFLEAYPTQEKKQNIHVYLFQQVMHCYEMN